MPIQENSSNLENRIDPWGNFCPVRDRGAWMGNRGILHDDHKKIVKPWAHYHWVTCRLDYEGNIREGATAREKLFTPGNYSELFFLDEATAFAVGHRPCAQCRNKRYKEFRTAWVSANRHLVETDAPAIKKIDRILHRERTEEGVKNTFDADLERLHPDGTMIDMDGAAFLIWRRRLYKWSFAGYEEDKVKRPLDTNIKVLTPTSIVLMYNNGFIPQVHYSAFG